MPALDLWNLASQLKSADYRWVDLTHTLSCDTPHWFGFKPFESTKTRWARSRRGNARRHESGAAIETHRNRN